MGEVELRSPCELMRDRRQVRARSPGVKEGTPEPFRSPWGLGEGPQDFHHTWQDSWELVLDVLGSCKDRLGGYLDA